MQFIKSEFKDSKIVWSHDGGESCQLNIKNVTSFIKFRKYS